MAHLYNPYATDQQNSAQAQSDPQRTSHPYPGSSYRSAPSADLYSSRAREESLHLPRSYAMTPPSQGQRQAAAESSDRSLDWPPTYKSTNEDDASKYYTSTTSSIFPGGGESRTSAVSSIFPGGGESRTSAVSSSFPGGGGSRTSAVSSSFPGGGGSRTSAVSSIFPGGGESRTSAVSSSFPGGGGSRFTTIGERKPHEQSIPGLGEYEFPVRETASTQPEFSRPKYTPESASNILLHFGLEKDDLEELISYPEDQITPQNLPFILRQIRQQKIKNPVNAVKVAPHPEPKPTTSVSDTDFGGRMREVPHQDYRPRGILKTSKVIDYGHISQFSAGPGEEVAMTSGGHSVGSSTLLMDSSGREAKGMNISSLISSCDQESSVPGLDPSFSFTLSNASLSTSNPPKQFPPPPKQVPQTASVPFIIPKTDTDSKILSGVSKSFSLTGPESSQLKSSKPCSSDTTSPSVAPGRRGLALYDSFNDPGRPLKQVPKVPEQKQKNQQHQQPVKQEGKKKQPAAQRNPTPQVDTGSSVPAPAQMYDYVATTPGMFPHSCSLCHTECLNVKEWMSHQNTKLHLENCNLLRTRFPEWDGELLTSLSASDVDARSSTTRPSQSRKKRRNSSSSSRSRSYSPQRHRGSGSRRDQERSRYRIRSRSRSNSPRHSSRRTHRSRSRSQSPLHRSTASRYRSRSRSYERRSSPRRRDDRRSSGKRSRSGERRSSEKSSARQLPSGSAEALAQKLLGSSAIQTLSNQSDLEAVVKTLAPALLAELTKMKTSPSSSSSSSVSKNDPKTKTGSVSADDAASTVRLEGVLNSLTHYKLEDTARLFGKPTSVVIYRKLKEAEVVFEKPEDAEKMRNAKSHQLMGMRVKSSGRASSGSKTPAQEQKKAPPTKTGKSRMSSSLSKGKNVTTKPVKVPDSGKPKQAAGSTTPYSLSKAQNVTTKPVKVPESGKEKQAAGSTTPYSLSKAQNVTTKPVKVPDSEKPKQAAGSTTPSSLSKAQNVMAKPVKVPDSGKQIQVADSTTQSSAVKSAAAKNPTGQEMKPTGLNKQSQQPQGATSGPKAPAADEKGSTSSEKKDEQKDKDSVIVGEHPDKTEKPTGSTVVEVLVKQESQEELSEKDDDGKRKIGVLPLTGELLGKKLLMKRMACVDMKSVFSPGFASKNRRVLQITNLPKYEGGVYTERDVVNLLTPFGFQHKDEHLHNIYVIPQKRMALAVLPTAEMASNVIRASVMNCFKLSGCKLMVKILEDNFRSPMEFYRILMTWMNETTKENHANRIVFINNISPNEAKTLTDVLKKIDNVKNYVPLLNKVFIEFYAIHDADRLGVWYSLLNEPPQHSVYRLGTPRSTGSSPLPKMAEKALPDLSLRLRSTNVPMNSGIPLECGPPFYVTMTTFPFIFPTICPWFNIPPCHKPSTVTSTIMMTGLPEDDYCQRDVTQMVYNLFHPYNIISFFYRVMVLPLQRRAFIFFHTMKACGKFFRRHRTKPYRVNNKPVNICYVDHMEPEIDEEAMYRQLMELSNARVPPLSDLDQRLLVVQVSEVSLDLIQAVMKEVASVGRLAGFLPLGNRICIEMLEPSDRMKVMEAELGSLTPPHIWKKVTRVDTVQSLRLHQRRTPDVTIHLEETKPSAATKDVEMVEQSSSGAAEKKGSTRSENMAEQRNKGAAVIVGGLPGPSIKTRTKWKKQGKKAAADWKQRTDLTTGEMEKSMQTWRVGVSQLNVVFAPNFIHKNKRVLQITNLPEYEDGVYTERDVADLLTPFGFQHEDEHLHNIYVIPQKRTAFLVLPTAQMAIEVFRACVKNRLRLSGCELSVKVVNSNFDTPMEFYRTLMTWMNKTVGFCSDAKTVFIKNVSQSEATYLKGVLNNIGKLKNFVPLLNKLFVEFFNIQDTDCFGVWYSLLRHPPQHIVYRLGTPWGTPWCTAVKYLFKPMRALPDLSLGVTNANVPKIFSVPVGCRPPFAVTMTTFPFVFPTGCPWFNIPPYQDFYTVRWPPQNCTVMMTCLPVDGYSQLHVSRLVWSLMDQRSVSSLFYRVMVLPLQRRAFIHFNDPKSARKFAQCHLLDPFSINNIPVNVHFLNDNMIPAFTEEAMYRQLMELSNARVPPLSDLDQRLLVVQVSEVSLDLIQAVMKEVASVGRLAGFLPLGNRICIEMLEPSDRMKVMEAELGSLTPPHMWKKVTRVDTVQSLQQQLQSFDVTIDLEEDPHTAPDSGSAPQTSEDVEMVEQGPSEAVDIDFKLPEGLTPSKKRPVVLTLSKHKPVFPTLSKACPEGQKLTKECLEGPTPSEEQYKELPRRLTQSGELTQNQTPIRELPQGPTSSEEKPEGLTRSGECPEGLTTSKQPKTDIKECSSMGKDQINSIPAVIQRLKQAEGGKVPMGSTADVGFSEEGGLCSDQDTDKFVTIDEGSDDTRHTAKNTQSSNSSEQQLTQRGQTSEQESKSSKSDECKEKSSSTKSSEEESSGTKSKERSLDTKSRSEEKSPNSSLTALSAVGLMVSAENTEAEPEKETPVEAPKEEETSVTQSPKSEEKQEEMKILDLFEEKREEESQLPGPEEDQGLDGLDSIDDEGTAEREESDQPQTDTSSQVPDNVEKEQSATDHVTEVAAAENVSDGTKVSNVAERPRQGGDGKRGRKSKVLEANKDITDQENDDVIESVQSPTKTEDPEPTSQAPKDVTPEAELEPINTLVDEQSARNSKKKQGRGGQPTRRSTRGRTSEAESEEKQDETQTKSEATKPDSITNKEGADEVPCTGVDFAGSETIQETQKVGRRSSKGNREKKITSQTASSKEQPTYQVMDTVEENGAPEKTVTATRSTRGRPAKRDIPTRGKTAAKECEEVKETSSKAEETEVTVEDSVEDEGAVAAPPVSKPNRKRGRPRKVKATSKPIFKKAMVEIEEESTFSMIDSKEEEAAAEDQQISEVPETAEESSTPKDSYDKHKITESVCEEDEKEPTYQLLTLDEVGADDTPEQPEAEGPEPKEELSIHDKGKDRPISESNQSLDPLKSESLAAVDGEKDDDRRHDDDITEESDFLKLAEAREQEVDPGQNAATSGRKEGTGDGDEEQQSKESQSDLLAAASSSTQQIETENAEASGQSDEDATASLAEGRCAVTAVGKRRTELVEPEAKRSRSQSPDFTLPTYNPCNPVGVEFVVPKAGFFCNICSIFYVNENTAKEVHCSSRRHFDNLKKYYLKLKATPSTSTSSNVSSNGV